jgi:hypothetical protein
MIRPSFLGSGPRRPSGRRGFAILISITLLAFLVLLLLSLALLTRVGTQISANGLQDAQARQNALVAVQDALGQLEKYAGPDQRTTAPAEFGDFAAGANGGQAITPYTAAATTGVVTPVAGTRWWTGVWGNSSAPGSIFSQSPVPKLLGWLVSGNEGVAGPTLTAYGQVTAAPPMPFSPTMAVANLSTSSVAALNTNVTIGGQPAVQLVGSNSATASGALTATDSFVAAPLVNLSVSAQLLPGFTGTTNKLTGRMAWAVLDEGVKAKVNLRDPYDGSNTLSGTAAVNINSRVRVQSAQRTGVELVTGFGDASGTTTIAYPSNTSNATVNSQFDRVVTLPETQYLDPNATSAATAAVIRQNFHTLTPYSYGVLADSQFGGLRLDLTALLEDTTLFTSKALKPLAGKNILPDSGESSYSLPMPSLGDPALGSITPDPRNISPKNGNGPQWDLIKSFYGLATTGGSGGSFLTTSTTSMINVQPGDATHVPVVPVLTQARMYNKVQVAAAKLQILSQVAFAVGNPYSVTLNIPNGLEFLWQVGGYGANWQTIGTQKDYGVRVNGASFPDIPGNSRDYGGSDYPVINNYFVCNNTVMNPNSLLANFGQTNGSPNPYGTGPQADNQNPSVIGSATFYTHAFSLSPGQVLMLVISGSGQTSSPAQAVAPAGAGPQILMVPSGPGVPGASVNDINANYFTYFTNETINDGSYTLSQPDASSFSIFMKDRSTHLVLQATLNNDHANYDTNFTGADFNIVGDPSGAGADSITVAGGGSTAGNGTNAGNVGGFFYMAKMPGSVVYLDPNPQSWGPEPGDGNTANRMFADLNWAAKYRPSPWIQTGWVCPVPGFHGFYLNNTTTGATGLQAFTSDAYPAVWGQDNTGTTMSTVIFDVPRRNSLTEMPVLSLGYLQHANLTADDQYPFVGHQPGNAVGNSWFSPWVTRTASVQQRSNVYFAGNTDPPSAVPSTNYYDMSYLLNSALWDHYYFSSIPQVAAGPALSANPRLQFAAGYNPAPAQLGLGTSGASGTDSTGLALPKEFAASRYLMINGAFNINSTSIDAWKAVLAGLRKRNATLTETASSALASTAFPRSLYQPILNVDPVSGQNAATEDNGASYGGFRRLSDAQIITLATDLVQEIRLRGPFTGLADFINRGGITGTGYNTVATSGSNASPLNSATQANTVQVEGALQMAIDRAGINTASMSGNSATEFGAAAVGIPQEIALNGHTNNGDTNTTFADLLPAITISTSEQTGPGNGVTLNRATGIPGWLTQADVLQALGPALAARSDTFVIRAYGDALDPVNTGSTVAPANILGRAWCEAVVQRFPDYGDTTNAASVDPNGATGSGTTITPANQRFGRKFRIVSFRWLTPNDI